MEFRQYFRDLAWWTIVSDCKILE